MYYYLIITSQSPCMQTLYKINAYKLQTVSDYKITYLHMMYSKYNISLVTQDILLYLGRLRSCRQVCLLCWGSLSWFLKTLTVCPLTPRRSLAELVKGCQRHELFSFNPHLEYIDKSFDKITKSLQHIASSCYFVTNYCEKG